MGIVGGLDATFNPQHLPNGVLVPVADFKLFPSLPEVSSHLKIMAITNEQNAGAPFNKIKSHSHPWVADLRAVRVNRSGSINFSQLALHVGKSLTHVPGVFIRKDLKKQKKFCPA